MRLFVSNFPYDVTDHDLLAMFRPYGCTAAEVMYFPESQRSRGFGFVEVPIENAGKAIFDLDSTDYCGRRIGVAIATPKRRAA